MKRYGITGALLIAPIIGISTYLSFKDTAPAPVAKENIELPNEQIAQKPSVEINENVFFNYDSYKLNAGASSMLDDVAVLLKSEPNTMWQVQGHTDTRGTEAYNNTLGSKRAEAVKNYLVRKGVDASKLNTISFGESTPVSNKNDEEAHAVNRRVEFSKVNALTQR